MNQIVDLDNKRWHGKGNVVWHSHKTSVPDGLTTARNQFAHPSPISACKRGADTYTLCLLKGEFCFLKPDILTEYSCTEKEPLRSPKGSRKDGDFPRARFMLLYHAKEGHPTTARPPYGKDKLVCRAICSFPLSTGRNVHLQIKKWSRHTKHSGAGLKGPAPVPWERAWPRGTLWSAAHSRRGVAGSVGWEGAGKENALLGRFVYFGICVGGPSRKGRLGHGLWSSPATSCSSLTFCLPSPWV